MTARPRERARAAMGPTRRASRGILRQSAEEQGARAAGRPAAAARLRALVRASAAAFPDSGGATAAVPPAADVVTAAVPAAQRAA